MILTAGGRNSHAPQSPFVRAALGAMGDGVMLADETGHIIYANSAADKILGVPRTDEPTEHWAEHYGVFHPETGEPFPADQFTLARALRGTATDSVEMLIRNDSHPKGIFIFATGRPVLNEDGDVIGGVTIIRDITELREKERKLREALASLEAAQQQKNELTGFLVHDMKSPLTSILANADLLAMTEQLDGEDKESLDQIRESTQTLHRMVLNLLDIQAAEDGRLEPNLAPVNPVDVLGEVAAAFSSRAPGVELEVVASPSEEVTEVLADPELLRRIVTNLVDNCFKYGPDEGTVWLEVFPPDQGRIRVSVSDEGPGVPPDLRDAIFERYSKVERDRARRDPTSRGLGLRFCKLAVEAHGGRIWVEDNEPTGARFCFELQAA